MTIAVESYCVLPRGNWLGDGAGLVAIIGESGPGALPLSLRERGRGFVAANWGEIVVVGLYASPKLTSHISSSSWPK